MGGLAYPMGGIPIPGIPMAAAAANWGGGGACPPIMGGGLGGIPPACISKGFPAMTEAPCTLVMGGLAEAAATPPVVAAAEMVAGLTDEPLVEPSLCTAYLGFLARCSSREISSGGCMILVVADVVAMRTGFLSSP